MPKKLHLLSTQNSLPYQEFNLTTRKILSIKYPCDLSFVSQLNLPKGVIQTILKKQFHKQLPRELLPENRLFSYGKTIAHKLQNFFIKSHSSPFKLRSIPMQKLKDYRRVMYSSKHVKKFQVVFNLELPLNFFKYIRAMKSLTDLKLNISSEELFTRLPYVLKNLIHLKKFVFKFFTGPKANSRLNIKKAFRSFIQFLSSANLQILELSILNPNIYKGINHGVMDLFSCLGEKDIESFQFMFLITEDQIIDYPKMQKLLSKVENLVIRTQTCFYPEGGQRSLNLSLEREVKNFKTIEIIQKCSSLKGVSVESRVDENHIPQDLGLARDIQRFDVNLSFGVSEEGLNQNLNILSQIIPQMSFLEDLSIIFPNIEGKSMEGFCELHRSPSNSSIRKYSLSFYLLPLLDYSIERIIFSQLTLLQSVENLELKFYTIKNVRYFSELFDGLPDLKALEIKIQNTLESDFRFPFENMGKMNSLEKLIVKLPRYERDEILPVLPRMRNIRELEIRSSYLYCLSKEITTDDYLKMK